MVQVGGSPISITETVGLFFQTDPPTASSDLYFHRAAACALISLRSNVKKVLFTIE